eukprot:s8024_g1.t1
MWGVLAAALFDWGKELNQFHGWSGWTCMTAGGGCRVDDPNGKVVAANLLMILCIIVWAGSSAAVTFTLIKWCGGLRIDEETEEMGMDAKSHSPPKAYVLP